MNRQFACRRSFRVAFFPEPVVAPTGFAFNHYSSARRENLYGISLSNQKVGVCCDGPPFSPFAASGADPARLMSTGNILGSRLVFD